MNHDRAINAVVEAAHASAWADYDASMEQADAISARAEQMTWSNDGISDAFGAASEEQWERFCAALRSADPLSAGREAMALVQEYGEQHVYDKARAGIESQPQGNHHE